MIKNIYREKLLNAVLYFAKSVNWPTKIKIFKLLYFLDFVHFKQIGRSVTNLDYYAWDFGPAPRDFWIELESGVPEDFKNSLKIETFKTKEDHEGFKFIPIDTIDKSIFTPRELKIMDDLVFMFKDATPSQMVEITHLKNSPWDKTIKEKGEKELIDFALAIDEDALINIEEALTQLEERKEFFSNYQLEKKIS